MALFEDRSDWHHSDTGDGQGLMRRLRLPRLGLRTRIYPLGGNASSRISLSAISIAEDAATGTEVGTLSVVNGSGSYTFTITADPDSKFAIDGSALVTDAALNHEGAQSHAVTIEADNGVDDPISRAFSITVTNVLEVTLTALTLSETEFFLGTPAGGTIDGAQTGETVSVSGTLPSGLTIDEEELTWAWSGSGSAEAYAFDLVGTHPDASNSPRTSNISGNISEAAAYSDEAVTLFAEMSTEPSDWRKGLIDDFIVALKDASIWTKIDRLFVFASQDSQAALLDWKDPTRTATAVNSPTFTADVGFQGDGSTSYLDTNFNPASGTNNFVQANAFFGIYSNLPDTTSLVAAAGYYSSGRGTLLLLDNGTQAAARLNSGSTIPFFDVDGSQGWTAATRNDGTNLTMYRDTTALGTGSSPVGTLHSASLQLGRFGGGSYSNQRFAVCVIASYLDGTENAALYTAMEAYLDALALGEPLDETAPTITSGNPSGTYAEDETIGGTLTADEDATFGVTGTDAADVTLDPDTGVWSIEGIDYGTKSSYSFTFTATDASSNVGSQVVSITITEVVTSGLDESLAAPVLAIESDQDEYPPVGSVEFDISTLSTDDWNFQVATDLAFSSIVIDETGTVGTEDITVPGVSAISSGTHYFRCRVERGSVYGPWSTISIHGDTTAPTITSSAGVSEAERTVNPTGTLTANEPVTWSITGGADRFSFTVDSSTGEWTLNATTDYETKTSYVVEFTATDMAGNQSSQTFTYTVTDLDEISTLVSDTFTGVEDATPSSTHDFSYTVAGLGTGVDVEASISSGTFTVNEGSAVSAAMVSNGDVIEFSVDASPVYSTETSKTLTLGITSAAAIVLTLADPDAVAFVASTPAPTPLAASSGATSAVFEDITFADGTAIVAINVDGTADKLITDVTVGATTMTLRTLPTGDGSYLAVYTAPISEGTYDVTLTLSASGGSQTYELAAGTLLRNGTEAPVESQHAPRAIQLTGASKSTAAMTLGSQGLILKVYRASATVANISHPDGATDMIEVNDLAVAQLTESATPTIKVETGSNSYTQMWALRWEL